MTNLIVPSTAQQPPTYPQINVQMTPQGVVFAIQIGPTIAITHLVPHDDMANIEQMRRKAVREMRDMQEMAERAVRGKL